MAGLFLNNMYSMSSNLKMSTMMCIVLGLTPILVGEESLLPIVVSLQIFLYIANSGSSLLVDETSKWNKYELTLPLPKKAIITAKYMMFLLIIILGLLVGSVTTLVFHFIVGISNFKIIFYGFSFGLVLALFATAFMYPIMLKIGAEKNELVILQS